MKRFWPFAFNFLFFASVACVSPFVVLYYQGLGFTGTQIGLLTSLSPLITLFSAPLWTGLADVTRRHRLVMSLALLVGVIVMLLFPLLRSFAPVLLVAAINSAFFAPVSSFADSATMVMLADEKEMYGRIRIGGTIGYGLTAPFAGMLVQNYGLRWAFWGCAALFLLAFFVSQKLVYGQVKADDPARFGLRVLLANPRWLLFLSLAVAGGLSLPATNTYFFPYLRELGMKESLMGIALTIGTLSEIPVLFFGNRLVERFKPYGLLMLTVVVTIIRFLLYAVVESPNLVLFIQLLNGLTFPAMWVAGVSYAYENAPPGMGATAQGIFGATVFGLGTSVGGFTGGLLLESVGGRGLYLVFGLVLLAVAAIVTLIERRLPAEQETLGGQGARGRMQDARGRRQEARGRRQGTGVGSKGQGRSAEERMRIGQLTSENAAAYQELRLFGLQESPAAFGSSYAEEVDRPLEVLKQRLADARNHVFGAFNNDGRLVGVATLRREQRVRSDHKAFLFGMYVLPEHRRQGIGRALLEAVISRAGGIGIRQVNLTVNSRNKAAVLLYESCGFERFGLERDAFRIGDGFFDAAYMVLRVRGQDAGNKEVSTCERGSGQTIRRRPAFRG